MQAFIATRSQSSPSLLFNIAGRRECFFGTSSHFSSSFALHASFNTFNLQLLSWLALLLCLCFGVSFVSCCIVLLTCCAHENSHGKDELITKGAFTKKEFVSVKSLSRRREVGSNLK